MHGSSGPGAIARFFTRRETGVAIILALTLTMVGIINPAFLQTGNIRDILINVAPAAIVACGLTFVIVTGEIDISVGSLNGLLAATVGLLASADHLHRSVGLSVAITLALGAAVGLINGLLVTIGRVPSIIVTLGMLTALRGVTDLLMGGHWIQDLPAGLRYLGIGTIPVNLPITRFSMPVPVLVAGIVLLSFSLIAYLTPFGRRVYAVGSNPSAAHLAGLSPTRIKIAVFTLTGLLVGVATVVGATRLSTIDAGIGVGFELVVVTAVVVGGTSISGGKGTILGALLGVILLGIVRSVLIFLKLGPAATYWERAIQGAFILIAVLVDHLATRQRSAEDLH
jgi:ribose/xylose/arabinose/galactoside ABC-type transport system permease subunit